MNAFLRTSDDELRDLAQGSPPLVDASSGQPTGATLVRCLGAGGMSTVYLAELDLSRRSAALSPLAPRRLAIKFTKLSTERQLARMNIDPRSIFVREIAALGRVMERKPPTEFVVGLYGSGTAAVQRSGGEVREVSWIAIEHVDGGKEGVTLTERVNRSPDGIDPVRALRLCSGVLEGVRVLHGEGVIHRDLKPDNVFVSGPIDNETPKLADCGIARVEGLIGVTLAAVTPAYGGPEQVLSALRPTEKNPLIGPWTDIHALSALVWFVLSAEPWCRSDGDQLWHQGERRSLRSAPRLHAGYAQVPSLVARLDEVLRRGAAHRLPAPAWQGAPSGAYDRAARARFASSMFSGPERHESVDAFAAALLPLLDEAAARWASQAVRENKAATAFRPTLALALDRPPEGQPAAVVHELGGSAICAASSPDDAVARGTEPGLVVFQPDGRVLARFGDRLFYFVDDKPHKVAVPAAFQAAIEQARWLVRGPGSGYALVSERAVLLVRGGRFAAMPAPARPDGGEIGAIQAVVGEGRAFGVVTAETDDSNGGPELWRSTDGLGWSGPVVLPLGGPAIGIADGPFGFLVVGASPNRKRARALFLGMDDQARVFTQGVNERGAPLTLALCSAGREAWGAGPGLVLRFEGGSPAAEGIEGDEPPVCLGLDMVGVPWLITAHSVLRRRLEPEGPAFRALYRRDPSRPALVAVGFTPDGARVLDERGGGALIIPHDIAAWRAASDTSLLVASGRFRP